MDYNPIQIITCAGLVFVAISPNGGISKFNPERCWIDGVIKSGHEVDRVVAFGTQEVVIDREGV